MKIVKKVEYNFYLFSFIRILILFLFILLLITLNYCIMANCIESNKKENSNIEIIVNNKEIQEQYVVKQRAVVSINRNNTSEVSKIKYIVIGANEIREKQTENVSTSIEITEEGESKIKVWEIDRYGNIIGKPIETTIYLDKQENNEPKIEIQTKSILNNGWYNKNVDIKIISNEIENDSEYNKLIYCVKKKGDTTKPKYVVTENSIVNLTIEEEGTTEIIAYLEGKDKRSNVNIEEVKIDKTPPRVASLTCMPIDEGTIQMIAEDAKDNENGSGIEEYIFFTDNNALPENVMRTKEGKVTIEAMPRTFLGEVVVYDRAGNESTIVTDVTEEKVLYRAMVANYVPRRREYRRRKNI